VSNWPPATKVCAGAIALCLFYTAEVFSEAWRFYCPKIPFDYKEQCVYNAGKVQLALNISFYFLSSMLQVCKSPHKIDAIQG
jgi:hypothetical protein